MEQSNAKYEAGAEFFWGLLALPVVSVAVFTRRRFGFRTVRWFKFPFVVIVLMIFYDLAHPDPRIQPQFFDGYSIAFTFSMVMLPLGLWRYIEAKWSYSKGIPRHTEFWGEPWLTIFWIPFRLACILDCVLIFAAGYYVKPYDPLLGPWLMVGGGGLFLFMLSSWQKQAQHAENIHNSRVYTEQLQKRVDRGPRVVSTPVPESDEEVVTGRRRR